jgi:hypothetical protein
MLNRAESVPLDARPTTRRAQIYGSHTPNSLYRATRGAVFVGFGGKLEIIAFVACLVVHGLLAVAADAAPTAFLSPADRLGS